MTTLPRSFFERPPDQVAYDLLGATIQVNLAPLPLRARLVEVEAYGGEDDPASHAYRGMTPRTAVMFGAAGHLYVYRSYGLHWCVNVVTEMPGRASAVLLRGAELAVEGTRLNDAIALRGPGNLTRGLGISSEQNGLDCCAPTSTVTFENTGINNGESVAQSRRVGVTRAVERPSRYFLPGSRAVSRLPKRNDAFALSEISSLTAQGADAPPTPTTRRTKGRP